MRGELLNLRPGGYLKSLVESTTYFPGAGFPP